MIDLFDSDFRVINCVWVQLWRIDIELELAICALFAAQ